MPDDYIKRSDVLDFLQIIPIDLGYREIDDVEQYVKNAPAADVLAVVRCKDCKHRPSMETNEIGGRVLVFPNGDENPCPCQNFDDDWYSYKPDDDFFCAYGAKMTEEENSGNEL